SVTRPHLKRETRRSCSVGMSLGGLSEDSTICLPDWYSVLNVWKNSSCVRSLLASTWMSSTTKTSTPRYLLRNFCRSPFSSALMKWFTNVSHDKYRMRVLGLRSSKEKHK